MIGFVEHATGRKFCIVKFKLISVDVMRAHDRSQTPLDRGKYAWKRKTTLFTILFTFNVNGFRINHYNALVRVLTAGAVHHKQTLCHTNLHRCQSHAWRRIHRLKHIADEFF